MGDKTWKAFERWVGEHIFDGAKRNPGSGRVNRDDEGNPRPGDLIHPTYQVDCKYRTSISIFRWWDKLVEEAKLTGKIPILVMREKGDREKVLVCIHWRFFKKLKDNYERSLNDDKRGNKQKS